ncbi:MAG TPA: glycosyltransferase family 2 protein [Devosia sp.]|nr:glycosyltransferase family 2 protein [Devosia sp.]
MPDLSVIVTFYRELAFIGEALNSIVGQGLDDFEIILVNDNPDFEIKEFLEQHAGLTCVRFVHQHTNAGLSAARNAGIEAASGTYLVFLDADDYFLPGGLKAHLDLALETEADLVHAPFLAGVKTVNPLRSGLTANLIDEACFSFHAKKRSFAQVPELQLIVAPWKFLHRREFVIGNSLLFDPELRKFEDRPFVLSNLLTKSHIAFHSKPTRVWRKRAGSITSTGKSDAEFKDMCLGITRSFKVIDTKPAGFSHTAGTPEIKLVEMREIVHTLARAIGGTELLGVANAERESSETVRKTLTACAARQAADPAFARDVVCGHTLADVHRRFSHAGLTEAAFFQLWDDIANQRWSKLKGSAMVSRLIAAQRAEAAR